MGVAELNTATLELGGRRYTLRYTFQVAVVIDDQGGIQQILEDIQSMKISRIAKVLEILSGGEAEPETVFSHIMGNVKAIAEAVATCFGITLDKETQENLGNSQATSEG